LGDGLGKYAAHEEQHASDQQVYGASIICIPVAVQAADTGAAPTTWKESTAWLRRKRKAQCLIFCAWTNRRSDPANAKKTGNWHGWLIKDITPVTLTDDEGRTVRIRPQMIWRG
jgi:hypothetical protein